ncbi:MAG: hypothetical protein HRU17_17505 [Polyangiaceae bacterium]|nr:hypothetical protein [Polyangiaceae bacterium]
MRPLPPARHNADKEACVAELSVGPTEAIAVAESLALHYDGTCAAVAAERTIDCDSAYPVSDSGSYCHLFSGDR